MQKNPLQWLDGEVNFLIDGPAGDLELMSLKADDPAKGVAIICHPHPLHEGSMYNKVVHTLSRAFHRKGIHALRFNFRGVGKSQGTFGYSVGEVEDLMAVKAWIDQVLPNSRIWLAGFSFGCYIAAAGATKFHCEQLFTVAPAVNHQPFTQLPPITSPWIVIQGENDEVVSPEEVYQWVASAKQHSHLTLIRVPNTTHFFHGQLITLRNLVEEALAT